MQRNAVKGNPGYMMPLQLSQELQLSLGMLALRVVDVSKILFQLAICVCRHCWPCCPRVPGNGFKSVSPPEVPTAGRPEQALRDYRLVRSDLILFRSTPVATVAWVDFREAAIETV